MDNKRIEELVQVFKDETKKISDNIDGVTNYTVDVFYKKRNPANGYHSIDAIISFKEYVLKLEYKINVNMLIPKSTLEMRFMFENGKLPVEYSFYDILGVIDNKNFKPYTISYIINRKQMVNSIKYLVNAFKRYKKRIDNLSQDIDKLKILEDNINKNIYLLLKEKVLNSRDPIYIMKMLELYYMIDLSRYVSDAYFCYMTGKYNKAIKKYEKIGKKMTAYEMRLLAHIKEIKDKEGQVKVIPENLRTFETARKYKKSPRKLISLYLSWLILTPVWCIIYDIIYYIVIYCTTKGAIYVTGADPLFIATAAFITAMPNSYFIRKYIYKIFNKKNYDTLVALDEIENTQISNNIMNKAFQFLIALGLVFTVLLSNTNISFYDNYFKDNLDFFSLKGNNISYDDVKCIYKTDKIVNESGKVIALNTYTIALKDKTKVDLHMFLYYEDIKENIIPIFEQKQIEVRHIELFDNIDEDLKTAT